jgi:hypothetical protein
MKTPRPPPSRSVTTTFSFWFYLVLMLGWTAAVVAIIVYVGGATYVRFYSRWMYIVALVYYAVWFAEACRAPYARFASFSLLLLVHGTMWLWVILTTVLVMLGAPLVFHNQQLLVNDAVGLLAVAMFLMHYSPVAFVVLYVFTNRHSLRVFYVAVADDLTVHHGRAALATFAVFEVCVVQAVPPLVYVALYNPFDVYELDAHNGTPYWLLALLSYLVMAGANALMLFGLAWGGSGAGPCGCLPTHNELYRYRPPSWWEAQRDKRHFHVFTT